MNARTLVIALALTPYLFAQDAGITSPEVHRTRAVWFAQSENPIAAEVGFCWQPLPWNDAMAKAWDGAAGTRIALGHDVWAALETFTDLEFGKVKVAAGNYYALLDKDKSGWRLGLLDPDKARALQLAPGGGKLPLVAAIPLQIDAAGTTAPAIDVAWQPADGGGTTALVMKLGPNVRRANAKVRGSDGASPAAFPDTRGTSRVLYFEGKGNPSGERNGFVVIDHGVVAWNDDLAQQKGAMKTGARWRLGKDWATTLDTNVPLLLGGKKLAPGSWHLTLGRTKDGWQLAVSSAADDHRKKLDGFAAQHVSPVLEVPMQSTPLSPPGAKLQIGFASEGDTTQLTIVFGPERLSVPVATATR